MKGLRAAAAIALAFLAATFSIGAGAQGPKAVKIVVPLPAGGAGDIVARLLADEISRSEGRAIVVENRPGAGSVIGTEAVVRSAPDGATLLINAPYLLIAPQVKKVAYDPLTSFAPICYLVSSPGIIVVNATSPYRTLPEFLAARAQPGALSIASVGPATAQHLGLEMLKRASGADFTYVPYAGGAPAINALLGNHVTAVFAEYAPLAEQIKAGALRALATSSAQRIEVLPDLPTVAESGYPGYEVDLWWGLFAPAGTPDATQSQLAGWFRSAIEAPDVKRKLSAQGFAPSDRCGADFASILRKQYEDYGRIIRDAKIKAE